MPATSIAVSDPCQVSTNKFPQCEWTVMVYMAGDNNLSEDMISQIYAITEGLETGIKFPTHPTDNNNVAFLVQYDGSHPTVPTYRIDLTYDPAATQNPMGHPEKLAFGCDLKKTEDKIKDFIIWSAARRPAKKYALVISGHSDGFQGRSLLLDEDPQSVTTLAELATAIKDGVSAAGLPQGKLDIIGFDSCVMSTIEVVYEFKDCAKIWIASQGSVPNYTWNYLGIARELIKMKAAQLTGDTIARLVVKQVKEYNLRYAFQGRSIDICAGDLTKIQGIRSAITSCWPEVISLANCSLERAARHLLMAHWYSQTFMRDQTVDIWDYCESLIAELKSVGSGARLITELEKVKTAVETYTIQGAFTGGDYRFSKGVSIFLPWSHLALIMTKTPYRKLKFYTDGYEGFLWYLYIAIHLSILCRPRRFPNISDLIDFVTSILNILSVTGGKKTIGMTLSSLVKINHISEFRPVLNFILNGLVSGRIKLNKVQRLDIDLAIEILIDNLLGGGQYRDNPPRTKDGESYSDYFGRTKNFFPMLETSGDY